MKMLQLSLQQLLPRTDYCAFTCPTHTIRKIPNISHHSKQLNSFIDKWFITALADGHILKNLERWLQIKFERIGKLSFAT